MHRRLTLAPILAITLGATTACTPMDAPVGADPQPEEQTPDTAKVVTGIIDRTNAFRKEEGKAAVAVNDKLTATAAYFAGHMARTDEYGHEADGNEPADRVKRHGYDYCLVAENIAYAFNSAGFTTEQLTDAFVTGWQESPGHRKNMLDPDATETGVAVAHSAKSGRYYAVQLFGRPKSAAITFSVANRTEEQVEYELTGHTFTLDPRVTRTHTLCRPEALKPAWSEEAVRPTAGQRLAVVRDADGLRLVGAK